MLESVSGSLLLSLVNGRPAWHLEVCIKIISKRCRRKNNKISPIAASLL